MTAQHNRASINPSKVGEHPDRATPSQLAAEARGVETVAADRSEFKGLLVGMLLGDGCLALSGGRNAYMRIQHGLSQDDYLRHKAAILGELTAVNIHYLNGKYPGIACKTRRHPLYTRLREIAYPGGRKTVTPTWLNWLTPQGVAIWYMDDGSLMKQSGTNKSGRPRIISRRIALNTCGFSLEENQLLQRFLLERFGIKFNINTTRWHDKVYYRLVAGANEARKLFELIGPYLHPSMAYKRDMQYQRPDEGRLNTGR